MKPQSVDTDPKAEAVQIALLQRFSTAKRARLARSLTASTISASRRTLRRLNPDLSERELMLLFVALSYGEALAGRLKAYLERREV